jgi:hypothetical protein
MRSFKSIAWRVIWALLALVSLAGCGALKGMGQGLGDVFKRVKFP